MWYQPVGLSFKWPWGANIETWKWSWPIRIPRVNDWLVPSHNWTWTWYWPGPWCNHWPAGTTLGISYLDVMVDMVPARCLMWSWTGQYYIRDLITVCRCGSSQAPGVITGTTESHIWTWKWYQPDVQYDHWLASTTLGISSLDMAVVLAGPLIWSLTSWYHIRDLISGCGHGTGQMSDVITDQPVPH